MRSILVVLLLLLSTHAQAIIFEWTGTCTFWCTGEAHAVLTMADDYVPGTRFACGLNGPCALRDVKYTDNIETLHFVPWSFDATGGGNLSGDPLTDFVGVFFDSGRDAAFFSGHDRWAVTSWAAYTTTGSDTHGINGRFSSAVPEPGTLALLLVGLLGMRRVRR